MDLRDSGHGATSGSLSASSFTSSSLSKAFDLHENVKIFAARSLGYANDYGLTKIAFLLNHTEGAAYVGSSVEGYVLGDDAARGCVVRSSPSVVLGCSRQLLYHGEALHQHRA